MLYVYKKIAITYKRNIKYFLFFINDNDLFKAIDRLYSLLIEEKNLVNASHVKIIDYKSDNFRLRW